MEDGTPKGAEMIMKERGIHTKTLCLEDMRIILANHEDLRYERSSLTTLLGSRGHRTLFLPWFHCELNGIERVRAHDKQIAHAYCTYSIQSLRENVLLFT